MSIVLRWLSVGHLTLAMVIFTFQTFDLSPAWIGAHLWVLIPTATFTAWALVCAVLSLSFTEVD